MTLGQKCAARFSEAKTQGRKLTMQEVAVVIDEEHAQMRSPRKKPLNQMTEQEWLDSLKQDPAMRDVNVDFELSRALLWAKQNGRQATRRFCLNWLLKRAAETSAIKQGATYATGLKIPPPPGPEGWREWLDENMPPPDDPEWGIITSALNCHKFSWLPQSWQQRIKTAFTNP